MTDILNKMRKDSARIKHVSFNPNDYDMHTVVEYNNNGRWVMLDPTFAMFGINEKGKISSASDIRDTVVSNAKVRYYSDYSTKYGYYINYPLLFLNIDNQNVKSAYDISTFLRRVENNEQIGGGVVLLKSLSGI